MGFKKMDKQKYPGRLWALVGYPGGGKSTFATQMIGPILPVDADHRFIEVAHLASDDIYQLSDNPGDNNDPDAIAKLLDDNMPGSGIKTIVVDSLTAIISPLVMKAVRGNDAGVNKNRIAAFKDKATAMRQLQYAVTRWGCDVLWIYHLQDGRDNNAKEVTTATLPKTERNRLHISLNAELHIVQDGDRRGVKVVWARQGRWGMTLWDDSGTWQKMPERVEAAIYDGLAEADQNQIAQEAPECFANPEAAMDWAMGQEVFESISHAQRAYDKCKREGNPSSARQMRDLWVADIESRLHNSDDPLPLAEALEEFHAEESGETETPAEPDPSDWLPTLKEFQAQVKRDFSRPYTEIKAALKDPGGFAGFKSSDATAMYNFLRDHFEEYDHAAAAGREPRSITA